MSDRRKILLTGGAGFIGSHTAIALYENGYEPIIVDDLRNSFSFILKHVEEIIDNHLIHYKIDCCDEEAMRKVFQDHPDIEGVVHFAAYKAVGESVEKPTAYYKNNIQSLVLILDLMSEFELNNFVFSSSCTVYGNPDVIPVTEDTPMKLAESPYGYTKQVGERICTDWSSATQKKATLLRYFNPIGSHESGKIGELPIGKPQNLVPFITQSAIGKLGPLTVYGNDYDTPDGSCIRDYIHVVDLAEAHVAAIKTSISNTNEGVQKINIGTGRGATVLELVNAFITLSGKELKYTIGERREGDVPAIYADCTYGENVLKWKSRFSMEDALKHAWQWELNLKEKYHDLING
jgi:UDP-glucose 4-epimerase